ncbi:MAG: hypothetical protein IT341_10780 [Chloroflexi bacterium]|nr:hypothetical protein [Chloroflexota bacterium]
MSRFIDRNETVEVDLGPCQCPTKPHDTDKVRVRKYLSHADQLHLADAAGQGYTEAVWAAFNMRVASWNFTDEKGKPVALSRANWQNLDSESANAIQAAIDTIREDAADEAEDLPNP